MKIIRVKLNKYYGGIRIKLDKIINNVEAVEVKGNINIDIDKMTYDSRKIDENTLFICIKGFKIIH